MMAHLYAYIDINMDFMEDSRTPTRFKQRVVAQFQSNTNVKYLQDLFTQQVSDISLRSKILSTLWDAVYEFNSLEILMSDPLARRGAALSHWAEVRRLNRIFYKQRLDAYKIMDEPYHVRAFESDSLYPPGLEHLNVSGLAGLENSGLAGPEGGGLAGPENGEDAAWDDGDPNRTAEQAMAEFYQISAGDTSQRIMRYEHPPIWQRTGDRHHDMDAEVLSDSFDSQKRRWANLPRPRKQKAARSYHMT